MVYADFASASASVSLSDRGHVKNAERDLDDLIEDVLDLVWNNRLIIAEVAQLLMIGGEVSSSNVAFVMERHGGGWTKPAKKIRKKPAKGDVNAMI